MQEQDISMDNKKIREIGNINESLLEAQPLVEDESVTFGFQTVRSNGRKLSGSYYTPSSLVEFLLDLTFDPILDNACARLDPEKALLDLKVCDPACGSGTFLIAAAQRIAECLDTIRSDRRKQQKDVERTALREVSKKSLYGVDLNPQAVGLSKVCIWLQTLERDKPLFPLDDHIKCGNSLLGIELDRRLSDKRCGSKMPNKNIDNKRESHLSGEVKQVLLNPLLSIDLTDASVLERWLDEMLRVVKNVVSPMKGKELILSLLFYKYLSDLSEPSLLDNEFYIVRPACRWEAVQTHPVDGTLGDFITNITREAISLNPNLKGILGFIHYGEYKDGKRVVNDTVLRKLIEIISCYNLAHVTKNIDFWDNTYAYLLQHLPDPHNAAQNQFYTPRDVARLMVEMIKPTYNGNDNFYDPACGSGCLSGLSHYLKGLSNGQEADKRFVGQDKISIASALAKMDLGFSWTVELYQEDTLRNPLRGNSGKLKNFDYVMANPPWNLSGCDREIYINDPDRFPYGIPPTRNADWGWVQHVLASLNKDHGRAAVILDLGALSRGSGSESPESERNIRKAIIEDDILDAIISLPRNLFYTTAAPCCLLIFDINKRQEYKGKVLFIDALNYMKRSRTSRKIDLQKEERDRIIEAYNLRKTIKDFCCVASLKAISSNDYDLRPVLYVSQEINIHYRSQHVIERELAEVSQIRTSNDLKILEHLHYPSEEPVHSDDILKIYLSDMSKDNLDEDLRALLENSEKSRGQELALEIERRERVSHLLFALDVERIPLKKCANIYSGFTPTKKEKKAAELWTEGEYISWVKAGDLEQEYILETEGRLPVILTRNDICSRRAVRPINTIVLAICGGGSTVGKTAVLGIPAAINQAVCCIYPQEDTLDHSYLFCYLTYMRRRWGREVTGGRQDLTLQAVKNHSLPLPDKKRQQEIVNELRPHNEKILRLKEEIALLRKILKA
ncbi:hypothetical protein KSF_063570 [Reticulibacter mediterranei]|uniref:site-specific DNA-methyltransferase (adenine-specific) n=1 Tax=Reticulibacter mediterranei TaxID=2778369 RepID=A0A8J3N2P6_9CHLR|nr:N-6 DNA methylase [Reticulibacter mediterranei]GHO96309.1 hypothetical protein KSF_063570 [Reticulibacter mediterranei]